MINCPLCGWEFDPAQENCRSGCPFSKGCSLIMCPSCRYKFVMDSRTVTMLKALFNRLKKTKVGAETDNEKILSH